VRDDDVALARGELLDDRRPRAALREAPVLDDHAEKRGVRVQVGVVVGPRDAGVDDGRARGAGRVEDAPDGVQHAGALDLGAEERGERPLRADDVVLHVHGDHGGRRRGEGAHETPPG